MPFSSLPHSSSQRPGSAQRSRRGRRERERLRKKQIYLGIGLAVVLLELLMAAMLVYFQRKDAADLVALTAELSTQEQALQALKSQRQSLEMELSILVQTRYPQLRKLVLDTVIPIAEGAIDNVRLLKSSDRDPEIEVILAVNRSAAPRPGRVRILLFDKVGVQVAAAELAPENLAGGGDLEAPWTTRVRLAPDLSPVYFALEANAGAL